MNNLNYVNEDLLKVCNGILAHGVNCMGVMNAGVAKQIRDQYPQNYYEYLKFCSQYDHPSDMLGKVHYYWDSTDLVIANCFTQIYYGYGSNSNNVYANPRAIELCLEQIVLDYNFQPNFRTINMPKIGHGLGGLDWEEDVLPVLISFCNEYTNWTVYVFTGQNKSRESSNSTLEPAFC